MTAVGNVRTGETRIFGKKEFSTAVDPGAKQVLTLDWKQGSQNTLATLGANGAFVDDGYADDHHLNVGSPVEILFPNGNTKRFVVKGIFDPPTGGSPFGPVTISAETWDKQNPQPQDLYTFVTVTGGCLLYTSPSPRDS